MRREFTTIINYQCRRITKNYNTVGDAQMRLFKTMKVSDMTGRGKW